MTKQEHLRRLWLKAVKTLVVLFTLAAMGWFIGVLPFAADLPFISTRLPVSVFFGSVLWGLALAALVRLGAEASASVDALLDFLPSAGTLVRNLLNILAVLLAYDAFQPPVYPFISGYEWLYQAAFLGLSLFFIARSGLLVYAASEQISAFLLGALNPFGRRPPPPEK